MAWFVEKRGGSRGDAGALVIRAQAPGSEKVVLPFAKENIECFGTVGEDEVFALGAYGSLVIVSCLSGAIRARGKSDIRFAGLFVFDRGRKLAIHKKYRLEIWSVAPLARLHSFRYLIPHEGEDWHLSELREEEPENARRPRPFVPFEKGEPVETGHHLIFSYRDEIKAFDDSAQEFRTLGHEQGFYRIDTCDWSARIIPCSANSFDYLDVVRWISPSGRHAIRTCYDSLPLAVGMQVLRPGKARVPADHADLRPDGVERYGIVLELWRIAPDLVVALCPTARMLEPREICCGPTAARRPSTADLRAWKTFVDAAGGANLPQADMVPVRTFHGHVWDVVWEPGEEAFWVVFRDQTLRRVDLEGNVSALIAFARWTEIRDGGFGIRQRLYFPKLIFLPDGKLRFGEDLRGYVRFDPSRMATARDAVLIPEDEDAFDPPASDKLVDKALRERTFVKVPLASNDPADRVAALELLADIFAAGVEPLIWGDKLRILFVGPKKRQSEADFFAALADDDVKEAVPALRRAILIYLDNIKGGESDQPWLDPDQGIPALAPALEALIRLDGGAYDVWRAFMLKRDGEHECHLGRKLHADHVRRAGRGTDSDVAFGAFVVMNLLWGGYGAKWNMFGLIDDAPRIVDAESFARLVMGEADILQSRLDLPDADVGNWIRGLGHELKSDDAWRMQARAAIERDPRFSIQS
ncbi:hypothetical protein [Sphingosinicella sp. CPCC 101087]|uniref:hypothetical protein n=1 Tax=Sphingosinicella sp. CPCC 101087 TaxID=2497754 RepID=UPI00101B6D80|nr:hypothetical protein [Sphingosinicella sp. CPCC 101087]